MRAIDTHVLVRLIARDDPRQVTAAEAFIREGAWISTLALAEAIKVLGTVYDLPPRYQADAIELLLKHQHLVIQDASCFTSPERPAICHSAPLTAISPKQ